MCKFALHASKLRLQYLGILICERYFMVLITLRNKIFKKFALWKKLSTDPWFGVPKHPW